MMLRRNFLVLLGMSASPATSETPESKTCDRTALEVATSRYVAALSTGEQGWLATALAPNASYFENLARIDGGLANTSVPLPLRVDYRRTTIDTTQCATYTELLATDPGNPWMIATQLRFGDGDDAGAIVRVDSIVTTAGDLLFNATHALHYYLLADWSPIAAADRDTRAVLQAAADAYFDVFVNKTVHVPWGEPCVRVEGGYLDANGTCDTDIPQVDVAARDRRYVIDEAIGSVDVISDFGILGPDSHEFRIEAGKIVAIHSMTLCRPTLDCGLAIPDALTQDVGF